MREHSSFSTSQMNCVKALLIILFLLNPSFAPANDSSDETIASIWQLDLQQAIGPASADWLIRSLAKANDKDVALFVVRLNTPGGLDKSMRDIIQAILASGVPVAIYVYPKGARAASAGTYMLYAAHIAAMSPATNLGATTPVQIGSPFSPEPEQPSKPADRSKQKQSDSDEEKTEQDKTTPTNTETLRKKQINDAVAYIRGLASLHKRNAEWAEKAVRASESLEADEALKLNVIDYIAESTDDLITKVNGKTVYINSKPHELTLLPYEILTLQPDWRHKFLGVITDPSIAYILLMIGVYGLMFEFYNPGLAGPGILGAICLLTALYALQLLPVSYAGLGLIFLGISLMVAEALSPSIGVLGIGGIVSFVIGSVMLMDTDLPSYQIALPIIAAVTVSSVAIMALILNLALRSRHQKVVSGVQTLIDCQAEVLNDFQSIGRVLVQGEIWQAHTNIPLHKGDRVVIRSVNGLVLEVEAIQ